ncbi:uncharacterized protein K02A2.6-like [Wyeomyia smithii]|uniref:uncharacterized protein K02A2.6-like n=1 Tax=Wyeomyia smithii TaxID=174621 RepID=UPI0024680AB6|nr:uncharacterized protein K02A2.6-like [Wyeomyia smithii]
MIAGLEGVDCFLDDFIIYSVDRKQHDCILEKLFRRIQKYGFHLRLEKCNFYKSEIRYLGFVINADGIKPDPDKVASIVRMPRPTDCQEAFDTIKKVLQSDLLLTHYNPSLELIVAGDASKTGIGAVIMHRFSNGQLKAIAHAYKHRTELQPERKRGVSSCLRGNEVSSHVTGSQFTLQTDHQPLLKVFGSKKGIPLHTANRLQRWALSLLGFDFNVEYVPTDNFGYADVLSWLISNHMKPEEEYVVATVSLEEEIHAGLEECFTSLPVNFKMVCAATKRDAVLQQVVQLIENGWPRKINDPKLTVFHARRESLSVVNGCIMMEERVVVPKFYSQQILKQLHRGHQGIEKMKAIARSVVYWPNIDNDIQDLVRRCDICASAAKSPPHFQPQPWPRADGPWKRIHLDHAGPLDGSLPETIITDNGTQFCSSEFKKWCDQNGIIHIRTAPYHPQSNGQAERFVDTMKRLLLKIVEGEGVPSVEALQTFLQVYRSTSSATLAGKSTAEEMLEVHPKNMFLNIPLDARHTRNSTPTQRNGIGYQELLLKP